MMNMMYTSHKTTVLCTVLALAVFIFPGSASGLVLTRTLSFGMRGDDVQALQSFLVSQNLLAADSVTGYFGPLTEAAVRTYQTQQGIVSSGTPETTGFGVVGPKTRAAVMASATASAEPAPAPTIPAETTSLDASLAGISPQAATPGMSIRITQPARTVAAAPQVATITIVDEQTTFTIPYIQTSNTLQAAAAITAPAGYGVKFSLRNKSNVLVKEMADLTTPYQASFSGLSKGEYVLDAALVNASGALAGPTDRATSIGIGDIITAIGDSITEGFYGVDYGKTPAITNWLEAPTGSASKDGRNFPQYGVSVGPGRESLYSYKKSWMTDLNDSLAAAYGYPVFIMNEGKGGIDTSMYITTMTGQNWSARQSALRPNKWLIHLGVNDGYHGLTVAQYETNLKSMINALKTTYGATASNIWVARPSFSSYYTKTMDYIPTIQSLAQSGVFKLGPDFWDYYKTRPELYQDVVHPNVAGMQAMAKLWSDVLTGAVTPTPTPGIIDPQSTTTPTTLFSEDFTNGIDIAKWVVMGAPANVIAAYGRVGVQKSLDTTTNRWGASALVSVLTFNRDGLRVSALMGRNVKTSDQLLGYGDYDFMTAGKSAYMIDRRNTNVYALIRTPGGIATVDCGYDAHGVYEMRLTSTGFDVYRDGTKLCSANGGTLITNKTIFFQSQSDITYFDNAQVQKVQ